MRASFSKAVSGSVVPFGPARLYGVVRGFWARALNLPFWGVSFCRLVVLLDSRGSGERDKWWILRSWT